MNSLGFDKEPAKTRVVVAMSGGVDSSVTAALLAEQGYDVVGITLQLYDHGMAIGKKGACCAGQDIYDARQVADKIGFPHYVLDYESRFSEQVMQDFADSYLQGETPIPCVKCNQTVKFRDLMQAARDVGAEAMATGHYVQRIMGAGGAELHRAKDTHKDQSYFLFATTQEQLDFLRFPLGGMHKAETRALAERYGLPVADKPDSQDICFVPEGDYAAIVTRLRPDAVGSGDIVHIDGTVMGRHDGIIHYTVGQRRGLNLHNRGGEENEPLYVIRIDAPKKQVIVGPRAALAQMTVYVRDLNWLGAPLTETGMEAEVKLRSAQPPVPAHIAMKDGQTTITLAEASFGVAPGQAGVVYAGDRLLGGGWITRAPAG